jgi:GT2 family glycosyltransferase
VGWAIAACVAARTSLLRRLGPFDPGAFLFYEDLDLCLRARAAGVPTVLRPELAVRHTGGHSAGRAFTLKARRRREVVSARLGRRALAVDDAAQALTFLVRAAVGRRRAENVAELRALRAARSG